MTITILITLIKSFLSNLIEFFTTKIGQYILLLIIIIGFISYVHHDGYKKGISEEHNKQQINIDKALEIQRLKQEEENKKALEVYKKEKSLEEIYKNKLVDLLKIIDKNKNLTSKTCKLSNSEIKNINNILEQIK